MKQKSNSSIIGRALATVAGFDRVYRTHETLALICNLSYKYPSSLAGRVIVLSELEQKLK